MEGMGFFGEDFEHFLVIPLPPHLRENPHRTRTAPVAELQIPDTHTPPLMSRLQIPFLRSLAGYSLPFLDVRAR